MAAPAITTATPVNSGLSNSSMSSPKDSKKNLPTKSDDPQSVTQQSNQADASQATNTTAEVKQETDAKPAASTAEGTSNAQPLAPPPRPNQNASGDTPDYFGGKHTSDHFQLEPNPFEQSFGTQPNAETPGKSLLPPVASLTSPSSLLPGGTPGWQNSLRSGPLSPAMLAGPASQTDYFDPSFRGGFPTPNESSLRTGLTPGGGGSMFPAPSPNSQALYNSLQSGGATPSTLDFHRTALSAAAQAKIQNNQNSNFAVTSAGPTSSAQEQAAPVASMAGGQQGQQQHQAQQQDPFGQHDANDAANGLFMLAQANGARNNQQQQHQNQQQQQGFAVPGQPAHNISTNMQHMQNRMGQQSQNTSPVNRRGNNSITSVSGSADTGEFSNSDDPGQKPNTRTRGKKGANGKAQNGNNRRKAEDTPAKAPASKKAKTSNEMPDFGDGFDDEDEDGDMDMKQETGPDGKKMTDEEKRKNFLERNRVAALKCRQRKKQWLANLQAKVELFSTENDALSAQVTQLREEIINLKTLLLAHKDCPVSQAQGLGGMAMNNLIGDINQHANPYGMAMQPNGVQMGMQMPQSHQQALQQRS